MIVGVSLAPCVRWGWLVKLKMLWPASLLIVLALLTAPNGRPASFLFFGAAVDPPSSRRLSSCAPHASLKVGGVAEIGNSLDSARLAVFARAISLTLAGYSLNYNIYWESEDTHLRAVLSVSISQAKGLREKLRYVQLLARRFDILR